MADNAIDPGTSANLNLQVYIIRIFSVSLCVGVAILAACNAYATTYYVSPVGSDANTGTSASHAWKTLGKVSSASFPAGDQIRLQGGRTFDGEILLDARSQGTLTAPVVIDSYGHGRATVEAGSGTGISIYNTSDVRVTDLTIRGDWNSDEQRGNDGDGIKVFTDLGKSKRLSGITILGCNISGFGDNGISIGAAPADGSQSGFGNVEIEHCTIDDNAQAGIESSGPGATKGSADYAHTNVRIEWCRAFNNFGIKSANRNTGNGIVLGDVSHGLIEYCTAFDNGKYNTGSNGGPVGIWAWDSNDIVIQYNESYRNASQTADGDGFDLDGGVTNSVMQYNYSHDNIGAGFLVWEYADSRGYISGDTVRYNISQNDVTGTGYGSITVGGPASNVVIYGNTLYSRHNPLLTVYQGTNISVYNNIFYAAARVPLIEVPAANSVVMRGNDYFTKGAPFLVKWDKQSYSSYSSWQQATGQEKFAGADTGMAVDPKLVDPGSAGTLGNPANLRSLVGYKLRPGSPLATSGIELKALGIAAGSHDYFGDKLPSSGLWSIGAYQPPSPR